MQMNLLITMIYCWETTWLLYCNVCQQWIFDLYLQNNSWTLEATREK